MSLLRFTKPHTGSGALLFGADGTAAALRLRAQMPAPLARVDVRHSRPMRVQAAMPGVSTNLRLHYDQRVYRGIASAVVGAHQEAATRSGAVGHAQQDATRLCGAVRAPGADAHTLAGQTRFAVVDALAQEAATRSGMQDGDALTSGSATRWQDRARHTHTRHSDWQEVKPAGSAQRHGQQDRVRLGSGRRALWQESHTGTRLTLAPWRRAGRHDLTRIGHWREAVPRAGFGGPIVFPPVVVPPSTGCYTPPVGGALLQFLDPLVPTRTTLVFRCRKNEGGTVIVPVRRVYMSINQIEVVTLPARVALDVLSLDIGIDVDSWAWSVSGSLPAAQMDLIDGSGGAPTEIECTVNGVQWVFVVEQLQRDREFGKARVRFSGRSQAAYLADPFSGATTRSNAAPATAQQLALDALPFGWSLDWQADDWLVPAGAWSHRGTPMEALLQVGGAIRAQVHASRTAPAVLVRARYPFAPWEWAAQTPDVSLPVSVVTREGIEWRDAPQWNRVFVSGTHAGIVGQVTRSSTAGDIVRDMVTDALITDTPAARQRGIAELAGGGRSALVSIEVPLIPGDGLGLIECGRLLEVAEGLDTWRGMVRSVSVSPTRSRVRQKLTVERHFA